MSEMGDDQDEIWHCEIPLTSSPWLLAPARYIHYNAQQIFLLQLIQSMQSVWMHRNILGVEQ